MNFTELSQPCNTVSLTTNHLTDDQVKKQHYQLPQKTPHAPFLSLMAFCPATEGNHCPDFQSH